MDEIYLDNNATTPTAPEVVEVINRYLNEQYGNPSSIHQKGIEADRVLKKSRQIVARSLNVKPDTIIFTSGGTESNNLALRGVADANRKRGRHIVTTAIEHPSVLETLHQLEEEGFDVTYVAPDEDDTVAADAVVNALTDDTILVSVMHVNNETGAIMPIEEIAARVKSEHPSVFFHADGVQGFGKIPVDLTHIDAYSASGHKIHAPKGVGMLYLAEDSYLRPQMTGGGHEHGWRSGTENVPGIAAFGKATVLVSESRESEMYKLSELKQYFTDQLKDLFDDIVLNTPSQSIPSTVNISFPGVPGEVLVNALSDRDIFVSTGSACSSKKSNQSHVLKAMNRPSEVIDSSLRFSMSRYTKKQELEKTINTLEEIIPRLKKVAQKTTF